MSHLLFQGISFYSLYRESAAVGFCHLSTPHNCWRAVISYMQMCIVIELHSAGCQNSTHFVLNGCPYTVILSNLCLDFLALLWSLCINSTISTFSLSQKRTAVRLLAGRCLFKLFQLGWWMCVYPPHWLLFGFSIHKWNTSFSTC